MKCVSILSCLVQNVNVSYSLKETGIWGRVSYCKVLVSSCIGLRLGCDQLQAYGPRTDNGFDRPCINGTLVQCFTLYPVAVVTGSGRTLVRTMLRTIPNDGPHCLQYSIRRS